MPSKVFNLHWNLSLMFALVTYSIWRNFFESWNYGYRYTLQTSNLLYVDTETLRTFKLCGYRHFANTSVINVLSDTHIKYFWKFHIKTFHRKMCCSYLKSLMVKSSTVRTTYSSYYICDLIRPLSSCFLSHSFISIT